MVERRRHRCLVFSCSSYGENYRDDDDDDRHGRTRDVCSTQGRDDRRKSKLECGNIKINGNDG